MKWRHFAEVFVFNDLNAFSLRPAEARNLHAEEGRAAFWKTVT